MSKSQSHLSRAIEEGDVKNAALFWRHEWAMDQLQKGYIDGGFDLLAAVIAPSPDFYELSQEQARAAVDGLDFIRASNRSGRNGHGRLGGTNKPWQRRKQCWYRDCQNTFVPKRENQVHCCQECGKLDKYRFKKGETCRKGHLRTKTTCQLKKQQGGWVKVCMECRRMQQLEYDERRKHTEKRAEQRRRAAKKQAAARRAEKT